MVLPLRRKWPWRPSYEKIYLVCPRDGHEAERSCAEFIEYYNSKEYTVNPDVVEYDGKKMTKPAFDLILGVKTLRELGIVLDF